jgi:hypothetical protein
VIQVSLDMLLVLDDEDGTPVYLDYPGTGIYQTVSDSVYRRNRWMGLFKRRLTRVRGFGREFWIDENWRAREAVLAAMRGEKERAMPYQVVVPANAKRRGCGCRGG